jgi:hypothetical protein
MWNIKISQPYGPPWPATGTPLLIYFKYYNSEQDAGEDIGLRREETG